MFPDMFTPGSQIPKELRDHLRYPEDLFRVQSAMYGRYHINDPNGFYLRADEWDLSQDPGSGDPTSALRTVQQSDPQTGLATGPSRTARMDPLYVLMRLPREQQERFMLLQPFVYHSQDDKQQNLSAFLTANSDPGPDYGKLQAWVMPRDEQVDGPSLVNARMLADPQVSEAITLLGRNASEVRMGNLLMLPMGDSLLYVRPMYVLASSNKIPELRRVIVVSGTTVGMGETLQQALRNVFGAAPPTLEEGPVAGPAPGGGAGGGGGGGGPAPSPETAELLRQASDAYAAAQAALARGDLGEYQRQVNLMADLVSRARGGSSTTTTTTTPSA
jgi:uncharacterized membrane protein (UPF0182 family)